MAKARKDRTYSLMEQNLRPSARFGRTWGCQVSLPPILEKNKTRVRI